MKLRRIVEALQRQPGLQVSVEGATDIDIGGVSFHSNRVADGDLFGCLPGYRFDGHDYAATAVHRGARALLVQRRLDVPDGIAQVIVDDPRLALAIASEEFFQHPTRDLLLVGVTGTSGKTTTAHLIRHILEYSGVQTGIIGTLGTVIGGVEQPGSLTTPEAPDLSRAFAAMRAAGDRAAVMEVSSHSLVLHRTAACEFDVAIFTNLAAEHLDFHEDLEDYARAKAMLFAQLSPADGSGELPIGLVNADDPAAHYMVEACAAPTLGFGLESGDIRASEVNLSIEGSRFSIRYPGDDRRDISLQLPARYNVYNATAAAAAADCLGISRSTVARALREAQPVPGRFEVVRGGDSDPMVVVDFAHTPDELENLLGAVRAVATGRVFVVFGCGGDRDRSKRPVMGALATSLADYTVISSDNPRSEDPGAIAREVAAGAANDAVFDVIVDRGEAIDAAISRAGPGDVVVVAGKGHETYQIFADETLEFDDRKRAREALDRRGPGDSR